MLAAGKIYRCACPYQASGGELETLLNSFGIQKLVCLYHALWCNSSESTSNLGILEKHTLLKIDSLTNCRWTCVLIMNGMRMFPVSVSQLQQSGRQRRLEGTSMRWSPAVHQLNSCRQSLRIHLETLAPSSWNIAKAYQAVHLQMEKISDGKPDGLSIFRISLQAWCAQEWLHAHGPHMKNNAAARRT